MADRSDVIRPREEDEELAEALSVLANPIRLAILRALRRPRALKEVRVGPREVTGEEGSILSRQGIRQHLLRLTELGAVSTRDAERDYGDTVEYLLSQSTLFALAERFRDLATLEASETPEAETLHHGQNAGSEGSEGPALVLVRGIPVGASFELGANGHGSAPWTIGREPEAEVGLTYDPFVSSRNARIRSTKEGWAVEDLPESRNGTRVNFEPLDEGQTHTLSAGDLIGVGRSLLLYRG